MCFSATASFSAAGIISIVGYYTTGLVKHKKELLMALIPMLFALQQLAEGVIWIGYDNPHALFNATSWAAYAFLFIAIFVWPIWIPLALYLIEPQGFRKNGILVFLTLGIAYSIIMFTHYLSMSNDVRVEVIGHSIHYQIFVTTHPFYRIMYYFATLTPMFLSSVKYVWLFGILNIIGLIIANYYFFVQFISVWCFFGAIFSVALYFIMRARKGIACEKRSID